MKHNYQVGDIVELNDDNHSKGTIVSVYNDVSPSIISIEFRKCNNALTSIQMTDTDLDNVINWYEKKIIENNYSKIRVELFGGEPLIHKDLIKVFITKLNRCFCKVVVDDYEEDDYITPEAEPEASFY